MNLNLCAETGSKRRCMLLKYLLVMKLIFLLVTIACLQVSARTAAQSISLSKTDAPLTEVFNSIKQQSNYKFFWKGDDLSKFKVTVTLKNANITETMDKVLKDLPLTYSITANTVVIQKKELTPLNKIKSALSIPVPVKGKVLDENGLPLIGATIKIKGVNGGVQTDENGEFIINADTKQATIVISYIGYLTREIVVDLPSADLVFQLEKSASKLDEVNVIAYGTTTQRLSTGAIAKVSAKEIESQPVSDPLMTLEGRVPGLIVTQDNGVPGSSLKVQIRGQNSIAQGSDPLFVIDGVPFAPGNSIVNLISSAVGSGPGSANPGGLGAFNGINTGDIESIEVLKDADATSIYGSRGANGVILITTKKGKAGKLKFNASINSGVSTVTRTMDMLNTQQYLQVRHEAFRNDGVVPDISRAPDLFAWDTTRYTDLKKLLIGGKAQTTDAQTTLSGGAGNTSFLVGAGFHRQGTVFPGDQHDNKGAFHVNLNQTSADKRFQASLTAFYTVDINHLIGGDLTRYLTLPPDVPPFFDANGKLNWQQGGVAFTNPLAFTGNTYNAQTDNLLSNLQLSYLLFPGLTIKSSFGYNTVRVSEISLSPLSAKDPSTNPTAFSTFGNNAYDSWIIEPQAEYVKNIAKGKLDILVGGTFERQTNTQSTLYASGFSSDALIQSVSAASTLQAINGYSQYKYDALFGRINYNWQDRYILNFTGRRDGSSRFGPGRQFGNFWSLGGAWIFSNEAFLRDNLPFLSFGKLRGSYGTSGNDQIGDYQYLDSWTNTTLPYAGTAALQPTKLYNADYSWEVNKKLEAAIELGFLKDRIFLTASYYRNRSNNQLISYKLPSQTGFFSITQNFPALVENNGWEFQLTSRNIVSKNFNWTTNFNISAAKNKLVSFPDLATSSYASSLVIGQPLSVLRAVHSLGVDPATGIYQFSGSAGPTATPDLLNDTHIIGSRDPRYYGGLQNNITLYQWQLNFFLEFKKQKGPNYYAILSQNSSIPGVMGNYPVAVLDRWQKPGDNAEFQMYTQQPGSAAYTANNYIAASDALYSDASYVRLKNISLSYNLPQNWLKKIKLENCQIYLRGQNLLTITNYKGNDPETLNFYSLPPLKTWVLGLQVTF